MSTQARAHTGAHATHEIGRESMSGSGAWHHFTASLEALSPNRCPRHTYSETIHKYSYTHTHRHGDTGQARART